jgi:catechol 2,3-dioxygenase-like lactoylglutathione lyase family enzyme
MATEKLSFKTRALTIACTDLEQSERLYQTVLGAARIPTDNGVGRWYRLGPLEIALLPNASERSPAQFPIHAMPILWLEVNDLAAAAERFRQHGVEVVESSDGQSMIIADPDGLLIEVWQAETGAE